MKTVVTQNTPNKSKSYKLGICKQATGVPEFIKKNYPKHVDTLIDVGAGYGDKIKTLDARRKIAVEPYEKFAKLIHKAGIDVIRAVAEYLPIRDDVADVILYWNVVMFVTNKDRTYSEIKRVAKNSALIFFAYYEVKTGNYRMTYTEFVVDAKKMGQIIKTAKGSGSYQALIRK